MKRKSREKKHIHRKKKLNMSRARSSRRQHPSPVVKKTKSLTRKGMHQKRKHRNAELICKKRRRRLPIKQDYVHQSVLDAQLDTRKENSVQAPIIEIKDNSNKKWLILSIVLLVIGLPLVFSNQIYTWFISEKVTQQMEKVDEIEIFFEENTTKAETSEEKTKEVYIPQTTYLDDSDEEIYLGKIAIPDIDLLLPIVKGIGETNLFRGAATNKIGQKMGKGNYPLSSHKMPDGQDDLLFSPLFRASVGQKIYITNEQKIYIYEVTDIYLVAPDQVDILDDVLGKTMITLYTCSNDLAEERLVIQGELREEILFSEASVAEQELFNDEKESVDK